MISGNKGAERCGEMMRNEKRSLIPLGLRVPSWKISFCGCFRYYLDDRNGRKLIFSC